MVAFFSLSKPVLDSGSNGEFICYHPATLPSQDRDFSVTIGVLPVTITDLVALSSNRCCLFVQACSKNGIDSRDLAGIVANDPVLTAELLRVSNSAFFSMIDPL